MPDGPLHQELTRLEAEVAEASIRVQAAQDGLRNEWKLGEQLLGKWWAKRDGRPSIVDLEAWTADLIAQVQERGLALALDNPGTRGLTVIDPALHAERRAAGRALAQAREELKAFLHWNKAGLAVEESADKVATLKAAIASDDFEAVKAALAAESPGPPVGQRVR